MGQRLLKPELKFYKTIDEILRKDWNPIGVQGVKETQDEYYNYLPRLFEIAKLNKSKQEISDYLFNIEIENMGLPGNREACNNIASLILEAKHKILK